MVIVVSVVGRDGVVLPGFLQPSPGQLLRPLYEVRSMGEIARPDVDWTRRWNNPDVATGVEMVDVFSGVSFQWPPRLGNQILL